MEVKLEKELREFCFKTVGGDFKKRKATVCMELEEDKKWHHCGTSFSRLEKGYLNSTLNNLADMIFVGKIASEVIKIKKKLNDKQAPVATGLGEKSVVGTTFEKEGVTFVAVRKPAKGLCGDNCDMYRLGVNCKKVWDHLGRGYCFTRGVDPIVWKKQPVDPPATVEAAKSVVVTKDRTPRVHLYDISNPSYSICGIVTGTFNDAHMTRKKKRVTCKRCIKAMKKAGLIS